MSRSKARLYQALFSLFVAIIGTLYAAGTFEPPADNDPTNLPVIAKAPAAQALKQIEIKGRAPKTGYSRAQFGNGWDSINGCDTRNRILQRDLLDITYVSEPTGIHCKILSGVLNDPYTGATMQFVRGIQTSDDIQIDHVVALSDIWQKGGQVLSAQTRQRVANDPLNLLAVNGNQNQIKADSDAATWLPPNKSYRCSYVARQIAVKVKYDLWMTRSEFEAINSVLQSCPDQLLPTR